MKKTITVEITDNLINALDKADQAHRDLYDENLSHDWRRGPGPLRLADAYAALAEASVLSQVRDD